MLQKGDECCSRQIIFFYTKLTLLCRRQSPEKFWKDDWRVFLVFDDAEIQKN